MSTDLLAGLAAGLAAGFIIGSATSALAVLAILAALRPAAGPAEAITPATALPPPATPAARPDGSFLAFAFDCRWLSVVLLEVCGPLLKVQEIRPDRRPGRIGTVTIDQVHPHDRDRVKAIVCDAPGSLAAFTFDPREGGPAAPGINNH